MRPEPMLMILWAAQTVMRFTLYYKGSENASRSTVNIIEKPGDLSFQVLNKK